MEKTERVELLLTAIEKSLRKQDGPPSSLSQDLRVEIERVRGEFRAFQERQRVHEGMLNGQLTRLHDRLDALHAENAALRETMQKKDTAHSGEINRINMHLKYSLGVFATLVFLLNFFGKIRDFIAMLMGGSPP